VRVRFHLCDQEVCSILVERTSGSIRPDQRHPDR
jgi:hypothetical protein